MAKFKQVIVLLSIILIFNSSAIAQESPGFFKSCGQISTIMYSSAIAAMATVAAAIRGPQCEEIQLSKTCTATFYGQGDGFGSGTTACGNKFKPLRENTVAIKTSDSGGFFSKSLCGKKALVTTKDPISGLTKTVEVKITDSGSMGGRTSRRCMDLSYRAASELGIVRRGIASNTTIKVCK